MVFLILYFLFHISDGITVFDILFRSVKPEAPAEPEIFSFGVAFYAAEPYFAISGFGKCRADIGKEV